MSWPKKDTRKIVVEGEAYLWHTNRRWDIHDEWLVIKKDGTDGQVVLLNPYHHDLPFGPKAARMAIDFAQSAGWIPNEKRAPMKLRYNGDDSEGESLTVLPSDWDFPGAKAETQKLASETPSFGKLSK